jgi:FkbM family methyltransferase
VFDPRALLRRQPRLAYLAHAARQAWFGSRQQLVVTPFGFRLTGDPAMQSGAFEPLEVELVRTLLPLHQRFIDIGANIGFYSCLARSAGVAALAVEPLPTNLRVLLANLVANGWEDTEVVAAGLSVKPGIAEIFGDGTGASLLKGWASLPDNTLLRERIPLTTLDNLIGDRFAGERLLIKIDVEGAECDLLAGAEVTLKRDPAPTWLIEICLNENFPHGGNPRFSETFERFFDFGYRAESASAARRPVGRAEVVRWVEQGHAEPGGHNYLFRR